MRLRDIQMRRVTRGLGMYDDVAVMHNSRKMLIEEVSFIFAHYVAANGIDIGALRCELCKEKAPPAGNYI